MLVIHVKLDIKADQTTQFLDAVKPFQQEAQQLLGCQEYTWYQSTEQSSTYILYEVWETEVQFKSYKASDLFTQTQQALMPYAVSKPDSHYYTAELLETA